MVRPRRDFHSVDLPAFLQQKNTALTNHFTILTRCDSALNWQSCKGRILPVFAQGYKRFINQILLTYIYFLMNENAGFRSGFNAEIWLLVADLNKLFLI